MKYDSTGFLQIDATAAGGALPIPNLNVRISGADEDNRTVIYSIITDSSGKSETVSLPAPQRSYSLTPDPDEQAYSNYIIEAYGDGFYAKTIYNVAIFSGIKSILPLEMVPDGGLVKNITPPDNNVSIIEENEDL